MNKDFIRNSAEFLVTKLKLIEREFEKRKGENYYLYDVAGDKHLAFHRSQAKIKILRGGNRSGKTTAMLQEMVMLMMGDHPFKKMVCPNKWWLVVSDFKKLIETGGIWDKIKEQAPSSFVFKGNENKNLFKIIAPNGSEVMVKSVEQGVKAFTTAKLHGFAVDERIESTRVGQKIQGQLRARILDLSDSMGLVTVDPLDEDEWLDRYVETGTGEQWNLEARDNKYIDEKEILKLESDLDYFQRERIVYGKTVDENKVYLFPDSKWDESNYVPIEPVRFGLNFRAGTLENDGAGLLRMFLDKDMSKKYVLAVDIATGVGRDDSVVDVWTMIDGKAEQVATWHDNKTEIPGFQSVIELLTNYYRTEVEPLVIIENKGIGEGVMQWAKTRDSMFPFLYMERTEVTSYKNTHHRSSQLRWGVKPEKDIKYKMVEDGMNALIRDDKFCVVHYENTYKQFLDYIQHQKQSRTGGADTYLYKGKGSKHDDLVSAVLMIVRVFKNDDYYNQVDYIPAYLQKNGSIEAVKQNFFKFIAGNIKVPLTENKTYDIMEL